MYSSDCVAGGIRMRIALGRSMPPSSSHSSMLSRLCESEPCCETTDSNSATSISGERQTFLRAFDQQRLPSMLLISPLWASRRNGCASGQRGSVLVEKRWWNTTARASSSGRDRSGNNWRRWLGRTMPL